MQDEHYEDIGRKLGIEVTVYSNGEEIGMFSEAGSVYATDILKVNRDGTWHNVTGQPSTWGGNGFETDLTPEKKEITHE